MTDDLGASNNGWRASFPYDRCFIHRRRIWLPLAEQLGPAHELLTLGNGLVRGAWNTGVEPVEGHLTLMLLFYRHAATTYQGLLLLLREGFSEQAAVLSRVLFEAMLDLYWVTQNPAIAADRLLRHADFHSADLRAKLASDPAQSGSFPAAEVLEPAELRRLRKEFKTSFTGENLYSRVQHWEANDRPELRFPAEQPGQIRTIYNTLVHNANLLVHGSMSGLAFSAERVSVGEKGIVYVSEGPSQEYLRDALTVGYWTFDRVVRLMLAQHERSTKSLDDLFEAALSSWTSVELDAAKVVGRNAPCPCGHEADGVPRKWKQCHGRPALDAESLQEALYTRAMAAFSASVS